MRITIKCEDNVHRTFDNIRQYKEWKKEFWLTKWYEALSFIHIVENI